jgi:hypothetical protein
VKNKMSKVVSLKIEEDLLERAKHIVREKNPLRYLSVDEIKYAAAAREALIFYIKENEGPSNTTKLNTTKLNTIKLNTTKLNTTKLDGD